MEGLHWKGRPSAARVALYTPKLSRKPRTVAMMRKAVTAKRFRWNGGTLQGIQGIFRFWSQSSETLQLGVSRLVGAVHQTHYLGCFTCASNTILSLDHLPGLPV